MEHITSRESEQGSEEIATDMNKREKELVKQVVYIKSK